jgi:predicted amidophosphoribosyltransferase
MQLFATSKRLSYVILFPIVHGIPRPFPDSGMICSDCSSEFPLLKSGLCAKCTACLSISETEWTSIKVSKVVVT